MIRTDRLDLIRDLRERVRHVADSGQAEAVKSVVPGPDALNHILAGRGFEPGTLVEWSSEGVGSGAFTLALSVAGRILRDGRALVIMDSPKEVYPPALASLGLPFDRTIIVQPSDPLARLWAWEQALRCRAVAVTVGWIDCWNDRLFHRLQLAVETGGSLGFLLRPAMPRAPTKAAVRLRVSAQPAPTPMAAFRRRLRVERLYGRGESAASAVELELDHETGHVHQVSALADPTPAPRWVDA